MFTVSKQRILSYRFSAFFGLISVPVGLVAGLLAIKNSFYLAAALIAGAVTVCFFVYFEQTLLGLLILRSALDPFSSQQLPAAFALGVDALTLAYVFVKLLTRQKVYTDGFWCFFAAWVGLQGLWVILLPLGALGMDGSFLTTSLREWVRLFSWLMMYLLVMQLRATTPPQKVIRYLFLSLVAPIAVAVLQLIAPSLLPGVFLSSSGGIGAAIGETSRVNGTLGHPATFATFLMLFMLLTYWEMVRAKVKIGWVCLLGLLALLFVSTKSLFSLVMMAVAIAVILVPNLSITSALLGLAVLLGVLGLFAGSEFGQERLASVSETPLLNRDMDISRAVLSSNWDYNSFNWRLAQWTYLLQAWQEYPILGYGLLASPRLTVLTNYAHNEYVRALTEGGIVGFWVFIVFLVVMAGRLIHLARQAAPRSAHQRFCWALLAMWLAMVVGMATENIWTHTTLFFYWWALVAVAGWEWDEPLADVTNNDKPMGALS